MNNPAYRLFNLVRTYTKKKSVVPTLEQLRDALDLRISGILISYGQLISNPFNGLIQWQINKQSTLFIQP